MKQCRHPNIINYVSHHWTKDELWVSLMIYNFFKTRVEAGRSPDKKQFPMLATMKGFFFFTHRRL